MILTKVIFLYNNCTVSVNTRDTCNDINSKFAEITQIIFYLHKHLKAWLKWMNECKVVEVFFVVWDV